MLSPIEIGSSREEAEVCVLLLHGLGASGHDFADVAQILSQAAAPRKWRFVLPHAPMQPVTLSGGMRMRAWYDIIDLSHPRNVNWDTVAESHETVVTLIAEEPATNIVLAGFSQGAAMALHAGLRSDADRNRIVGILMMSGYLLESEAHPCPTKTSDDFPIGLFHGTADPVVPFEAAERTVEALTEAGYAPTLTAYPSMEHSVWDEEIRDVFEWLTTVDERA
jgi:phospholipase/carboxylesterase